MSDSSVSTHSRALGHLARVVALTVTAERQLLSTPLPVCLHSSLCLALSLLTFLPLCSSPSAPPPLSPSPPFCLCLPPPSLVLLPPSTSLTLWTPPRRPCRAQMWRHLLRWRCALLLTPPASKHRPSLCATQALPRAPQHLISSSSSPSHHPSLLADGSEGGTVRAMRCISLWSCSSSPPPPVPSLPMAGLC